MSGYILQPTASASGHVINWTALPGVVVGYQNFPGAIVSLDSLPRSAGQQFQPSFPASAAEGLFRPPGNAPLSDQGQRRGHHPITNPRFQQVVSLRKLQDTTSGGIRMKSKSLSTDEDVSTAAEVGDKMLRCRSVNYCRICRVTFNAPAQAQQHYAGRHHARKVRLCSRSSLRNDEHHSSSASSSSTSHISSSTTASAAMTIESTGPQNEVDSSAAHTKHSTVITCDGGSGSTISATVYCRLCSVAFNSDKQALQHYAGKIHAKRLRAENVIYAYNRNGRRKPSAEASSSSSAAAEPAADAFGCFVCGLLLKSQRLLDRHQRRHRPLLNRAFSGLGFSSPFSVHAGY